jgi:hypothetical protein
MGKRGPKARTLRAWLKGLDKPVRIVVTDGEGDEHTVKVVRDRAGQGRWSDMMATIETLSAVTLKAYDAADQVLGSWDVPEEGTTSAPAPGYAREAGDSDAERMMKTFAHLLADAHKSALEGLRNVVNTQSQHFAEERKAFANTMVAMERLVSKTSRMATRLRTLGLDENDGGEKEEKEDELLGMVKEVALPLIKGMVQREVGANGAGSD